ncbi:hypothetical protein D046_2324B, partial [Vibrio parahaemolyticus V-223/04]
TRTLTKDMRFGFT